MKNLNQSLILIISLSLSLNLLLSCGNASTNTKSTVEKPAKGKISGVVTYYFNDNLEYVPDVGANVYIVLSSDVKDKEIYNKPEALITFCSILDFRNIWLENKRSGITIDADLMQRVHEYQLEDTAHFNAEDKKYFEQFLELKDAAKITKVVDANGNFSAEVDAGEYFVLIISSHRTGLSLCEIHGKPYFKWITLKPDTEENVSPKFDEF